MKVITPRGTKKITEAQLVTMKKMRTKGYSYERIAKAFCISRTSCFNYLSGKAVPYSREQMKVLSN